MTPKQFSAKLERLIISSDMHYMEVIGCLNNQLEITRLLAARDYIEFSAAKDKDTKGDSNE